MAEDAQRELYEAIDAQDLERIRAALDRGANANADPTEDRPSPLMAYIIKFLEESDPNIEIIRLLLDRGANPNGHPEEASPLVESLLFHDVARLLLERGANPDNGGILAPPLHWVVVPNEADLVEEADIDVVRILLDAGANPNVPDPKQKGVIPLERAVVKGEKDIVRLLLSRGANANGAAALRSPPLHYAIANLRDPEMVSILLEGGANVNAPDPQQEGILPLERATRDGNAEIVHMLLQRGADPNMAGTMSRDPPFMVALRRQNMGIIRAFVERGVNVNMTSRDGLPAIHAAGTLDTIEVLRAAGADLNTRNEKGETMLTAWLRKKVTPTNREVVNALIERGADVNAPDGAGHTPLFVAIYANEPAYILALLERGADPRNTPGSRESHAIFDIVVEWGVFIETSRRDAAKYARIAMEMIRRGVDPNIRGTDGDTLLHRVTPWGRIGFPFLQELLTAGVDPNAQDEEGMTALERLAFLGVPLSDVNAMIALGFDPNFRNPDGTTLLHRIVNRPFGPGHIDAKRLARVVQKTLRFTGIDINARNGSGETALHLAARRNNLPVVEALLAAGADKTLRVEGDGAAGPTAAELATDRAVKEVLMGYLGKSRGDIDLMLEVFDNPANISICPVCMALADRVDGCRYMAHICRAEERDERLYQEFKGTDAGHLNRIEWCTECGRMCDNHHRHFTLESLAGAGPRVLAPIDPARNPAVQGGIVHYLPDCRASGGGGLEEKFVRFLFLIQQLAGLQLEARTISQQEAKAAMVAAYWNGPTEPPGANAETIANLRQLAELLRNPPPAGAPAEQVDEWNGRVASLKTFGVDLSVFEEDRPPVGPAEAPVPEFPRPEADRGLLPIRMEAPPPAPGAAAAGPAGTFCVAEAGPHDDGRPTFRLRHRQPDGRDYTHPPEEAICGEDLVSFIKAKNFDGKCPINPATCTADLHPDELDAFGDQIPEAYRRTYREQYNKFKAGRLGLGGGRRKTYRKKGRHTTGRHRQRGGKIDLSKLFRRMEDDEYTCGVQDPAF